jgi:5-formyltetrahydrofolate cyclo-ligase
VETRKADVRREVLARRDALSAVERKSLSERITRRLVALASYRNARCVMAYASFGSEFETEAFVSDVLARKKALVLPRVERGSRVLHLHAVRDPARDLAPGIWGIPQPHADSCPTVPAARLDFVLVPGVAFTRSCGRLGYGGGYYDGFIRGLARRPALVAAAFELQIVPELPTTDRDQSVDLIVTEDAEYRMTGSR